VSALHEFCVDLALRYFVPFLYNLNGFMEPLRTGLSEGAFCVLGDCRGEKADPSASLGMTIGWRMTVFLGMTVFRGGNARSLDFASGSLRESDAALGMTNFWLR
jgi:hypothetical protein